MSIDACEVIRGPDCDVDVPPGNVMTGSGVAGVGSATGVSLVTIMELCGVKTGRGGSHRLHPGIQQSGVAGVGFGVSLVTIMELCGVKM